MPLTALLGRAMRAHNVKDTNRAWAAKLGEDPGTLSKVLNRQMPLTDSRAAKWGDAIYPASAELAERFRDELLLASQGNGGSVHDFCDRVVANGGAVHADAIGELLLALSKDANETHPLVCIEYRDRPRASPGAKYQTLGDRLAQAIAHGVAVAMFQPFVSASGQIPKPSYANNGVSSDEKASIAADTSYLMEEIRDACRTAYFAFRHDAIQHRIEKEKNLLTKDKLSDTELEQIYQECDNRIRLYEGYACNECASSGFGSKIFYVQWKDKNGEVHKRIFEWVSTPTQDWFLYRGEAEIRPDSLRDSFYPVPHFFESDNFLPLINNDSQSSEAVFETVHEYWRGFRHPKSQGFKTWRTFSDASH
jgi:hypothetical protein